MPKPLPEPLKPTEPPSDATPPIGVFDSGVGGLTVLEKLVQRLPGERFVYLGDTANMPFGGRPEAELVAIVNRILAWLAATHRTRRVVAACNSSAGLLLSGKLDVPPGVTVIDPISALTRGLVGSFAGPPPYRKIAVLATAATVASGQYGRHLREALKGVEVLEVPCEGLARAIEDGQTGGPAVDALLRTLLAPLEDWRPEAVILGCTHYPLAQKALQARLPQVVLLDPAAAMAQALAGSLAGPLNTAAPGGVTYCVSGDAERFETVAQGLPLSGLAVQGVQSVVLPAPVEGSGSPAPAKGCRS